MASPSLANAISHWYCTLDGIHPSATDFYDSVEEFIRQRKIPDVKMSRVEWREGGIFSEKRLYLRVHRKDHVYDICAAPFGDSFFVSSWLCKPPSFWLELAMSMPGGGMFGKIMLAMLKPQTYFQIDSGMMFMGATHAALLEAIDKLTSIEGARPLSEIERKPILRDLHALV